MKTGIIIIDPGYGGMDNVSGSDVHHAVSALGDLAKNFIPEVSIFLADQLKLFNTSG